jgi:hypothetical protein
MARSISTYCGEPREEYGFFKIPHSLRRTYAPIRPKQFWGTPPPKPTIPGNDAARECEQTNNTAIKQIIRRPNK